MRNSNNGLYEFVGRHHQTNPGRDSFFVFTNKRHSRIKLLYLDGPGLRVATKRLENGRLPHDNNEVENRIRPA